ncbi:MAG: DMT family transporter [Snowella sp.]|nr:DMT family transporter [Snowella sp.]
MAGFFAVLFAAVLFCFHNLIVRILFAPQKLLGVWEIGGFVTPTLNDSLLLLLLRMIWVVPLMALVANRLYAQTWTDLIQLVRLKQHPVLTRSLACGLLMFLYLVLLYISISLIPTGIALTLFFTYPIFTALLAWRLFGDIPTLLRWGVIFLTLLGTLLTIPYHSPAGEHSMWLGIFLGIASGITYAGYTIFAQQALTQIHPVPFTWISFAVTLILSIISLSIWHPSATEFLWLPIGIGSLLSALFTFAGHVLNNWGIRLIGASRAAMIGAANPALTVVLAALTIQENLNGLQVLGVALVTLSVALLNYEKARPSVS